MAEGFPFRLILMGGEKASEISVAPIPNALIDFYWIIEPYFRPIKDEKGEVVEYQRKKGCFLISHSLIKLCLARSKEADKVILLPYKKETENLDLVWFFEKIQ